MSIEIERKRKKLIPIWIKAFGWLFMVMSAAVVLMPVIAPLFAQPATYEIFGLSYQGSPFSPLALLISAIIFSLGISAYGLLFGKYWGITACLITGYGGVAICLFTMVYSFFVENSIQIRLELLIQIPYLLKLHKIKSRWFKDESNISIHADAVPTTLPQ